MYEAYWELSQRPFESVSDERFYYPSEGHQGALLKLRYTVETGKGAGLLVGDHGSGKTMLVDMLREQLPEAYRPLLHLVFPRMPAVDLLGYIAGELDPAMQATSQAHTSVQASVQAIQRTLKANTAEGRHAVMILDEAHLIEEMDSWDALRLLLNFVTDGHPDLTVVLSGQLPLLSIIDRMPSWEERLAVKCVLKPFSLEETACYIQHRLQEAGGAAEIFSSEAVEAIHRLSGGLPRRINRLADLALVIGYAEEIEAIGSNEIEAVCGELVTVGPKD